MNDLHCLLEHSHQGVEVAFILQAHIVTNWTDKARYARANALLLDDSPRNCQAFITAGGHAVHHTGDLAHSLQAIRAFLNG